MKNVNKILVMPAFCAMIISSIVSAQVTNPSNNLSIAKAMYDAVAKGDFPSFLGAMDQKIEWNEAENFPYADGNPYIGPDAVVKGVFQRIMSDWEYWTPAELEFHETKDEMVIITGRYNAKNKTTGKIIKAQFVHMWWFKNGKAMKFQQYADTQQVNKAMTR